MSRAAAVQVPSRLSSLAPGRAVGRTPLNTAAAELGPPSLSGTAKFQETKATWSPWYSLGW